MRLTPSKEQAESIEKMATEPTRAALLASDLGTGKTLMSVELALALKAQTVLIIGPLNTKGSVKRKEGWEYTAHRQGLDLPFRQITSTDTGKANFARLKAGEPGVYFVGREFFHLSATSLAPREKKDGTWTKGRDALWSWDSVKPDLAVFDEVQSASNRNSNTYKVLKSLRPGYRLAASATPQGNRFQGLWSVTRWLWPDLVDRSFWRWVAEYADTQYNPHSQNPDVTGERVPGAFVATLPCYIRLEANRTPVDTRKVYVDLTPRQRNLYDQMETAALAWLDTHPLVADLPIVQRARLRQITLAEPTIVGTGKFDEDGEPLFEVTFDNDCESSKIDALETIISKYHPTDPILVYTDSQRFARVVAHRLGSAAAEWSGKVSQKERERIKADFLAGKIKYLVAVIPAMAEGVDGLQSVCSTEVWMSESLNGMLNEQAEGRINRRGQTAEQITQWKILARRTDDDKHFQNLLDQRRSNRATLRGRN